MAVEYKKAPNNVFKWEATFLKVKKSDGSSEKITYFLSGETRNHAIDNGDALCREWNSNPNFSKEYRAVLDDVK